jgi:hypothetical protein
MAAVAAVYVNGESKRFNAVICPDSAGLDGQIAQQADKSG